MRWQQKRFWVYGTSQMFSAVLKASANAGTTVKNANTVKPGAYKARETGKGACNFVNGEIQTWRRVLKLVISI